MSLMTFDIDTMPIDFVTIRVHADTVAQLRRMCAFKQMQTGDRWTYADMIDELLLAYPEQETVLPADMFKGAARKKKDK